MKNYFTSIIVIFLAVFVTNTSSAQLVTSGDDDGSDGTLRQEIADTPAGGEITFGVLVTNVTLNSELVIDKELTITGGLLGVTIDADENGRVFNITDGLVTLNDLTITNGLEEDGGAIYIIDADLIINDSNITNSEANGPSGSGGGIFVDTGASLTVNDSEISGNQANRAGGGIEDNSNNGLNIILNNVNLDNNNAGVDPATGNPGNGGGLHITGAGDAEITGGTVNGNSAELQGGGLWNGTGNMTVDGTTVDGNSAEGDEATDGGGGIYNSGGTLEVLNGATITNNIADGTSGSGGGIFNDEGTLTVNDSEISNNESSRAGGGIEHNSANGGSIMLDTVTMEGNSTASNPGNGGALHISGPGDSMIMDSTISNNTADLEGGGLWNGSGTMTVDGTTLDGNTASGNMADEGGGGIYNNEGTLNVQGATITGNIADGTSGSGGGILNNLGTLTVSSSTISGNTAVRAGGGIEENSVAGNTVTLNNVDLDGNVADSNPGNGGALHISGPGNVDITDGSVTNNTASREGGGLWNSVGTMTIDGVLIDGNTAEGNEAHDGGAGVFNNGGTLTIINETEITNNLATGTSASGGGILSTDGSVNITESILDSNSANRAGGAIEIIDGNLIIDDSELTANDVNGGAGTANPGNGGAIHVTGMSGIINIDESDILNNEAANEGGGLWNQSGTAMNVNTSTVASNSAPDGGGIYNNGGMLEFRASTLSNNSATANSGGGLNNDSGSATILRSTVSGNDSAADGGGIYNNDEMDVNAVTITLNTAVGEGGGIEAESVVSIKNTIVADNTAANGQDVSGSFSSNGYNLIGNDDNDEFPEASNDIEGIAPNLGPLQDNGGLTFTHELLSGSEGIDDGDPADTFVDQRNFSLVGNRDIGSYERGGVLGVNNVEAISTSTIYPNPTNGIFTIEVADSVSGKVSVTIVTVTGKVVKQTTVETGANQINLSGMAAGMYIVNVQTENASTSHKLLLSK
ncbi:T9SS type A sorting domain-containing protein [Marixanthomonas ophiurae]|uniref:T9SS C-terminal target domain-containing protein n=1 Tax=Marixanthomonas ophiurae TaxID=387659 RepID=A0A3E1Q6C0_9FLAO|nr:T9SS type A sorting domain-containing protein [Marixanthomonas ophiurae]RFN57678.1 T9SS C-terminal target domain-containing protein [Marixanthomonas ophiurae]